MVWSEKTDDFFPYADCEHCYWGGYFTSRPTLKYFERIASSYLQVVKQFSTSTLSQSEHATIEKSLFDFTAAVGLINHHDAVTGTSKQHVADDYIKILAKAFTAAEQVVHNKLSQLAFPQDDKTVLLASCRQTVNESTCALTQSAIAGDQIYVVAYNAQGRKASQQVSIFLDVNLGNFLFILTNVKAITNVLNISHTPLLLSFSLFFLPLSSSLSDEASVSVVEIDADGKSIPVASELSPSSPKNSLVVSTSTLVFPADNVPALSFARFLIQVTPVLLEAPFKAKVLKTVKTSTGISNLSILLQTYRQFCYHFL